MLKVDEETRIRAYNLMRELKEGGNSRNKIVKTVTKVYEVSEGLVYDWYSERSKPWKLKREDEKLEYRKELFYVIGALLGDGCAYHWKKKDKYIINIVGEEEFTAKYANKVSLCINKGVKNYFYKSKYLSYGCKVWIANVIHQKLFFLFVDIRKDMDKLVNLMKDGDYKENSLQFIEGYFDAEGCVKVIKESVRKTPKICLDICNTDYNVLELVRRLLKEHLDIEARYSVQIPKKTWKSNNKKIVYYLRIYKKSFIQNFFDNMETIKLKPDKIIYVENWLNNGK